MDAMNHKRTALVVVVSGKLSAWCHQRGRIGEPARLTRPQCGVSRRKQTPADSLSDSHPDRSDLLCIEYASVVWRACPHSNTTTHSFKVTQAALASVL